MTSGGPGRKGGLTGLDELAPNYQDSLSDPWRHRFSGDADFFVHQRCRAMLRELPRDGVLGDRRLTALFLPERITFDFIEDGLRWMPLGGQYYLVARKRAGR